MLDAGPHFFRGHEVAAVRRHDATLYRVDETRIVVEKTGNGLLCELGDEAAFARGEAAFLLRGKIDDRAIQASVASTNSKARAPSPLAGEGVMRSMTDEGSHEPLRADTIAALNPEICATPHPAGSAGHLLPQGEKDSHPLFAGERYKPAITAPIR